ncbi:MAG: mechanosensitive ion channel [Ekhidna sp.]|nr:mechanosensitive ion channel [Ekhidna sp.]
MEQVEGIASGANKYSEQLIDLVWAWGPKVVTAILTLVVGLWIIGIIVRTFGKAMQKREVDASLAPFLKSLVGALLKVMLFISVIGMVGIEATSFVAVLGAAGLAVGLALQGTLQNFAGGVIILLLKPFKVGDWIDTGSYSGSVYQIQIFNTILKSPDNKTIIIPNGGLANSSLTNYSTEPRRRVDFTFGVGYGDSTDKTKATLMELIEADERILKDPAPFVAVSALADSSVNFVVRVWVQAADYWGVHFDMNENVYNKFNEAGLNIPFPQMDVHLHNKN